MHRRRKLNQAVLGRLCEVLASIDSAAEIELFLEELLTPSEVRDVSLRWQLLELLKQGVTQRQIAADLRVSLCKITRGAKILKQPEAVVSRFLSQNSANKPEDEAECK